MALTNDKLIAMAEQCYGNRENWMYMKFDTFCEQIGEKPGYGESRENFAQRLNDEFKITWKPELFKPEGAYLRFTYLLHENGEGYMWWALRKKDGTFFFNKST